MLSASRPGSRRADRAGARQRASGGRRLSGLTSGLLLALAGPLHAEPGWRFEARLGGAWSAPLPIELQQDGYEDLRLEPSWSTNAFEPPLYYGWRIARWGERGGWALDLTHHKLHLEHPPPEVQRFEISHGYNLLTLQRLTEHGGWLYGFGAGVIIAHPESEVRAQAAGEHGGAFGTGYHVSGPTADALLGHSRTLAGRLLVTGELKLTLSYASVPIAGGDAGVPNLALHGAVGLAWSLPR